MGMEKPAHILAADLPLAGVPKDVHPHLLRYAHKIACAIYYREQRRIASRDHYVWATWTQGTNRNGIGALEGFISMTPLIVRGTRRNVGLGDRFGYRCNKADDPDALTAVAQFGSGLVLAMLVVSPDCKKKLRDDGGWVKVAEMLVPPD